MCSRCCQLLGYSLIRWFCVYSYQWIDCLQTRNVKVNILVFFLAETLVQREFTKGLIGMSPIKRFLSIWWSAFRSDFLLIARCLTSHSKTKYLFGLNCRILRHLFASHWIRIASIVRYLVLQSTLSDATQVMAWPGYSAIASCDSYDYLTKNN